MVTFVFNKNKSSLLDNELYYSHDEEQTNAIYKLVTEDTWPGNGATRRLKTTRLYRDTNIYPVGEISLRWKEKHHAVVSGKRSLKPTANTFGNGLSFYGIDKKNYTWKESTPGSWTMKERKSKQEMATVSSVKPSSLPQIRIMSPVSQRLPDDVVTTAIYLEQVRLWSIGKAGQQKRRFEMPDIDWANFGETIAELLEALKDAEEKRRDEGGGGDGGGDGDGGHGGGHDHSGGDHGGGHAHVGGDHGGGGHVHSGGDYGGGGGGGGGGF